MYLEEKLIRLNKTSSQARLGNPKSLFHNKNPKHNGSQYDSQSIVLPGFGKGRRRSMDLFFMKHMDRVLIS